MVGCNRAAALARGPGPCRGRSGRCLDPVIPRSALPGPLGEGALDGYVLTCPWHGWQYDVRTGKNEFDLAIHLQTYEVVVEDGEVKVAV